MLSSWRSFGPQARGEPGLGVDRQRDHLPIVVAEEIGDGKLSHFHTAAVGTVGRLGVGVELPEALALAA